MSENQVITVITALTPLYPFLFALAALLFQRLAAKLPHNQQAMLKQIAQLVVSAVEQMGAGKTGQEKKQMAVDMIENILQSFHITISSVLIDALVESAVYGINQGQSIKLPPVPTSPESPNTPAILEQPQNI
jgi:LL-H family phage holin